MRFTTPRELGLRIRDRRMELGWSQAELANRIEMTRQWVIGLEKGAPGSALGTVLRTLSELGLVLDVSEPHLPRSSGTMMLRETPIPLQESRNFLDSVVNRSRLRESTQNPALSRTPLRPRVTD